MKTVNYYLKIWYAHCKSSNATRYLLLSGGAVGLHLLDGEEVRGDELPELPPVLAVGGEADVRRAVQEDVGDNGHRPRGEHEVVSPQDRLRRTRGRHHQVPDGAEPQEHQVAVAMLGGEVPERDLWPVSDEVQVAHDGQSGRRRRGADILLGRCLLLLIILAFAAYNYSV